MEKVIDVKKLVEENKKDLKERVEKLRQKGITPKMTVILANDNEESVIYVGKKEKVCAELGIISETIILNKNVTNEELLNQIDRLNKDSSVHGILVQMPLFRHLDENKCIQKIDPNKDVDGLNPINIGKLVMGLDTVVPCTAKGVMKILEYIGIEPEGKKVAILGRSLLVGKPVYSLMLNQNAQVQICHTKTVNTKEVAKAADILIVAIGKPKYINEEYVKNGATVIDVGINRLENGKIVGDVDLDKVIDKVQYITKVPGGVGLTTVVSLCENLIELIEKNC